MPTLSTPVFNTFAVGLDFTDSQTWTILPGVIVSSTENDGVFSLYNQSELINYGAIISTFMNYAGVKFDGDNSIIDNQATGLILGYSDGVLVGGDTPTINNAGLIVGKYGYGVDFWFDSKFAELNNTGVIKGGIAGVYTNSDHDGGHIVNHGLIHGDDYGVYVNNGVSALTWIDNYGTIEGGDSIRTNWGGVHLENHGTLTGSLRLANDGQTDEIINAKKIAGNVLLGGGDDTYDGTGGTSGGIFGQDGNDTLIGGSHAEKLDGGLGKDRLTGAGGADRFDYNQLADSQVGAMRDVITRFSHAQHDRIDLADLYDYTLKFMGTDAFTGKGQLRYVLEDHAGISHDRTMIYASVDADSAPEFQIEVSGLVHFVAGDFFL